MSHYMSSSGSSVAHNHSGSHRSTSGTSASSRTSPSSHSSYSHSPSYGYKYSDSYSEAGYPPHAVYRDPVSGGQRTEIKTRVNHKKQEVCVTNYNQRNNDRGEPKPEYRDASRYYSH